jgi:GNAT superfamily N-acetyltransferase
MEGEAKHVEEMSIVCTLDIVRVRESEIPQLYDLLQWRASGDDTETPPKFECAEEEKPQVLATMRDHIRSDHLFVWAARFEQWFVGYISVAKILKPDSRVYFYIDELWVPKPFRRHGIAFGLLQKTIHTAKTMNIWCIRLVAADTPATHHLYRKAGFEVDERSGWGEMKL